MTKPTLYIIHGWAYSTEPWTKTITTLEKQGINVEMLNVPGLTAPSRDVWTIADYMKWADQQIPDGAVALGHSNGGRILLNLCSQNPAKLKHLILLDAAGVYEPSKKRDLAKTLSKTMKFLKKVPGATKVWHKVTGSSDYDRAPENMKKTLAHMLDSDKTLELAKVTTPTSIIWGEADTVTPPRQAEKMRQEIPNSTLETHANWTHAPYISHPTELAKVIFRILKNPPRNTAHIDDTLAISAAHVLKRAANPTLEPDQDANGVVPGVPTKLELKTGKTSPAEKIILSDEDAATLKYEAKPIKEDAKPTDVSENSASANFKKAKPKEAPKLDSAAQSASASLPKADKRNLFHAAKRRSASLALQDRKTKKKSVSSLKTADSSASSDKPTRSKNNEDPDSAPILTGEVIASGSLPKKRILARKRPKAPNLKRAKIKKSSTSNTSKGA